MKKKFNFYCVLMLVALFFTITLPMLTTVVSGLIQGWDVTMVNRTVPKGVVSTVGLLPRTSPIGFTHEIYNERTQKMEKMQVLQALVNSETTNRDDYKVYNFVVPAMGVVATLSCVAAIVFFVLIIVAVNRNQLFDVKMERRLTWCGALLLLYYASQWVIIFYNFFNNLALYHFKEYLQIIVSYPQSGMLLSGVGMLLIGQIFSIARRLKEEQELTI